MIKNYFEKARLKKYESLVTHVKSANSKMATESTRSLKRKFGISDDRIEKLAILMEMSKRFLGKVPFDVQLIAALAMHDGYVLNMFTGEGKTISGALTAALYASDGKQVIVTTANDYLSKRDAMMMQPLFNAVGIESGVLGQNRQATVLFKSLTGACLDWLNGFTSATPSNIFQNSFFKKDNTVMIVDEIDYSLIELSMSPLHIVENRTSTYDPELIYGLVLKSSNDDSFYKHAKNGGYELTDNFFEYADKFLVNELNLDPSELNSTHYNRYIEFQNAWVAQYVLKAGKDYIVDADAGVIKKFNRRTGRSVVGGFGDGVLNFLHKKEQLPPPTQNEEVVTSTLKFYIRSFETVVGMSGTSECNKMELNKTYGLKVFKIPARKPSKLVDHGYVLYETDAQKEKSLVAFVNERLSEGRPVLLVSEDNASAGRYYDHLSAMHTDVVLLLGEDEQSEAELIKDAGHDAKLTITTRLCARGTDIVVDHDEGLSLVVSGLGVTDIDDLQLNGRTARAGKKGEVIFFASSKDQLFVGFKEGSSAHKLILLNCQPEYQGGTFKIDETLSHESVSFIRRVQLECVKAMREQRKMVIAYQSPIEAQLEIMKKKRMELWNVGADHGDLREYVLKMIEMVYADNEAYREQAKLILGRFCTLSPHYHAVINHLLNACMTSLWAEHNDKMRVLLSDSFSSGAGMDVGKYNNKCHELFNEFARTLNEKLLDHVIGTINSYVEEYLMSLQAIDESGLNAEEVAEIGSLDGDTVSSETDLTQYKDEDGLMGDAINANATSKISLRENVVEEVNELLDGVRNEKA